MKRECQTCNKEALFGCKFCKEHYHADWYEDSDSEEMPCDFCGDWFEAHTSKGKVEYFYEHDMYECERIGLFLKEPNRRHLIPMAAFERHLNPPPVGYLIPDGAPLERYLKTHPIFPNETSK